MTATTTERYQTRRDHLRYADPVAATTKILAGTIVCLNAAGNAVPPTETTGLVVRGVAEATADNTTGAAGDLTVTSRPGVYRFANSASGDLIARAEIGDDCYLVDNQTVAKTSNSSARSIAGKVVDVDSEGVWVALGIVI